MAGGKCQECYLGAWEDRDRLHCNLPQLIVPTVPTLPPDRSDNQDAAVWLGLKLIYFLKGEEFDNAQALLDSTALSRERATNGAFINWLLLSGYESQLGDERPWDEQLARLRQWRTEDPESGAAALMEAKYWMAYAWFARGTQFAVNVPEQAFKSASERIAKARAVLEDSKPYAASNPAWYAEMLEVAVFEGWPRPERVAIFDEALTAEPLYDPIYEAMARSLTPRWGGSLEDYHRFVRGAVEKTRASYGDLMYARLYWELSNIEWDRDPFKELKIPWQKMKSGFDDMLKRYPDSKWNLQNYAHFACRAGDGRTFNALLPRLPVGQPKTLSTPWREPYTREYCVARFAKAQSR